MTRIVITGAGIAGLSIARAIRQRDSRADVVVLEGASRTGGNIRTETIDGYLCEWGPDGFLDSAPATMQLVRELHLEPRLQPSSDAARRRFIFADGRLCEVPVSPQAFLKTRLLSVRGRLRVACEPFARRHPGTDESIHDFAARRIGREAAAAFVDPMVAGIFAGDARSLSLRACFPKMAQIEADHGGLFRGLLATRRARRGSDPMGQPAGRLTSFQGGLSELTVALARVLGDSVHISRPALSLRTAADVTSDGASRVYSVDTPSGSIEADAVVLAGPARESARLVRSMDSTLASLLENIPTAPLAVVCLGYAARDVAASCSLNGFGFLVRPDDETRVLGVVWESSIYSHRAPAGKVLLRVMIGGARDPGAVAMNDRDLLETVQADLARTMGIASPPDFVHIVRHTRGIPQYVKGHLDRLDEIEVLLRRHPGLHLAGNSYRGVSINACIAESGNIADRLLAGLRRCGGPEHVADGDSRLNESLLIS